MTSTTELPLTEEDTTTGEQPPNAKTSKGTTEEGWNNQKIWVVLAALLEVGLLVVVSSYARHPSLWQFVTAWLPAVLILYHALNLSRLRPPIASRNDHLTPEAERVAESITDQYGWDAIVSRYILPALLLPIIGMVAFRIVVMDPQLLKLSPDQHLAFKYGLAGAYFFVFLELGKRSVRNDIAPVSILWCLITLTVGPTLALLIPSVFTGTFEGSWSTRALWVFAGYAPRLVFESLAQGVSRSLHIDTGVVREERQIPLGKIQGIGVDEINRLAEEGVTDVHALACADPIRLMRDTRFDNERILSWIDQALLVSSVPEDVRQQLLRRGYQQATDLEVLVTRRAGDCSAWHLLTDVEADAILKRIAEAAGVTEPEVRDMLARLVEDPRVKEFQELGRLLAGRPKEPPPKGHEKQPEQVTPQPPAAQGSGQPPQAVSEKPAEQPPTDKGPKEQPPEKADAAKKGR